MENVRPEKSSAISRRLFRYSLYLLVVPVLIIPLLLALRADADVAVFLSDNYIEEEAALDAIDENGVRYIERERKWSNFQGSVPEGVTVNKIMFRLSWSEGVVVREELPAPVDSDTFIPTEITEEATTTPQDVQETVPDTHKSTGGEGENNEQTKVVEEALLDAVIIEEIPVSEALNPVTEEMELLPQFIDEKTSTEPQDEEVEVASPPSLEESSGDETSGFEQVSFSHVYPWATVLVEEEAVPVTVLQQANIIAVDELNTEASIIGGTGTTSTSTEPAVAQGFLEIRYMIDGVNWHVLDTVDYRAVTNVEFFLVSVAVEDIPNLQISVRYVVLDGSDFALYFDTVRLEAEYGVLLEEAIVPEEISTDQEPNFKSSFVRVDIVSENIRAVLLERGGMLEFWYSVTSSSGEVVWRRLAGGDALQEGTPIAIKERTIFWFDRNQETLFGLSVDSESVFGVPYDSPEKRTFRLPFETENKEEWQATYDPQDNVLKFERVRKLH